MPWYNDLRPRSDDKKIDYALLFPDPNEFDEDDKIRTIDNLLILRNALSSSIPPKRSDQNLLLASWNIKEFGHSTQRLPESYFYIAEIINRFDLVAVQEVKRSLYDLNIIMRLLGSDWDYMITDITEGNKGNRERSAYLYNKRRVKPSGLSGEITLWDDLTEHATIKQLHRTPHITGFEAGWKKFSLINLHLTPGDSEAKLATRAEEVELLLAAIKHKKDKKHFWNENIILLGDMNLYNPTSTKLKDQPTIDKVYEAGFIELQSLLGLDTNASQTEAYDRMFFHVNEYFKIALNNHGQENADVFTVFDHIFTDTQATVYRSQMKDDYDRDNFNLDDDVDLLTYFVRYWRKNQVSDHYPIWAEIIIDSSDSFLEEKKKELEGVV
jgi:endonuclease/exonuclease/phosphatase family metal-dependent hydrolase